MSNSRYAAFGQRGLTSDSIVIAAAAADRTPISALNPPKNHAIDLQRQFQSLAGEFISRIHYLRSQQIQATRLSE